MTDTKQLVKTTASKRDAQKAYQHAYYLKNRARLVLNHKSWWKSNLEKRKLYKKKFLQKNPDKSREYSLKWRTKNKKAISIRVRNYYQNNKERLREEHRKSYHRNKLARRDLRLIRCRNHYQKHKEKLRANASRYRQDHKNECRVANKIWRDTHPDLVSYYHAKRRALLQAEADINLDVMKDFISSMKSKRYGRCYYCEKKILTSKMHLDHIVALSKGGQHCVENLCFTCPHCNLSKHDKSIGQWVKVGQQVFSL